VSKLFGSVRSKFWIAVICGLVLLTGVLTMPAPRPSAPQPSEERATPLLEQEVERRQQLRIFEEVQQLGPRVARHSVTIPAMPPAELLPSDLTPPPPRVDPAGHALIISADGELLTAAGALRGQEQFEVNLFDGRNVLASVVAFDPDTDLVLLRADDVPRTDAAPWATTPPSAGMLAVAVSHVGGQVALAPVFVMTAADAHRRVRTTTADLLPGTPLFTAAGEVFAIAAGEDNPSALLIAPAVARLRERIAGGQARRGALGLTFRTPDAQSSPPGISTDGVLVAGVAPFGPAAAAGVQPGDLLRSVGGERVMAPDDALRAIAALRPGAETSLSLVRAGKSLTLDKVVATSALALRVRQTSPEQDPPQ
jgi:S1-C subfamily serine protease